jgi:hypothetical protein
MDRNHTFLLKDIKAFAPGYQIGFEAYEIILDVAETIIKKAVTLRPITIQSLRQSLSNITLDIQPIFESHDDPTRLPPVIVLEILQQFQYNVTIDTHTLNILTLIVEHIVDSIMEECIQYIIETRKKRITGEIMADIIDSNPDFSNLIN